MSDVWYLAGDGKEFGPFSLLELQARLRGVDLTKSYVWRDGFADWKRAVEIEELRPRPPKPPPFVVDERDFPVPAGDAMAGKGKKWLEQGAMIVSGAIGIGLARTLGMTFWLPALLIMVTWFVLAKWELPEHLRPVMAILIGHMAWQIIGFSILYAMRGMSTAIVAVSLDIICVIALSVWVFLRHSMLSMGAVLLYEAAGIETLVSNGDETHVGQIAVGMHIFLRVAGVVAAGYAMWVMWQRKQTKAPLRGS